MSIPRRWAGAAFGALVGAVALVVVLVLSRALHEDAVASPNTTASTTTLAGATPTTRVAPTKSPSPVAPQPKPDPVASTEAPSIDEVLEAQGSTAPGTTDVLVAGLTSTDAVVVAESANGLVARGALSALPALVELDIVARPWAAPSAIYAMGHIAAKADPEDRTNTVDHLLALLASEKRRPSPEALANLLHIYEALGHTGDPRAIAPLEAELVDRSVATAPKVIVVQALVALAARQSKPTLERVANELAPTATGDDFEAAVRRDLLAAIREALVELS
jgi:hypothetical protein